jgi:hypothetical protein
MHTAIAVAPPAHRPAPAGPLHRAVLRPRAATRSREDTRPRRLPIEARSDAPPDDAQVVAGDGGAAAAIEALILERCARQIAQAVGRAASVVVPGAEATRATLCLLEGLDEPAACRPVDSSRRSLRQRARALGTRFPRLRIEPLAGDLGDAAFWSRSAFALSGSPGLVYLPGTRFDALGPGAAHALLCRIAATCPAALLVVGAATARCSLPGLAALARASGWRHCQYWSDGRARHALHVLEGAG